MADEEKKEIENLEADELKHTQAEATLLGQAIQMASRAQQLARASKMIESFQLLQAIKTLLPRLGEFIEMEKADEEKVEEVGKERKKKEDIVIEEVKKSIISIKKALNKNFKYFEREWKDINLIKEELIRLKKGELNLHVIAKYLKDAKRIESRQILMNSIGKLGDSIQSLIRHKEVNEEIKKQLIEEISKFEPLVNLVFKETKIANEHFEKYQKLHTIEDMNEMRKIVIKIEKFLAGLVVLIKEMKKILNNF